MRNHSKMLLLQVIPPEQSYTRRCLGQGGECLRRGVETLLVDFVYLASSTVKAIQSVAETVSRFGSDTVRVVRANRSGREILVFVTGAAAIGALLV